MLKDPLNEEVTLEAVEDLCRRDLMRDEAYDEARRMLVTQKDWFNWVLKVLLVLGITLVLAGIIFFFAYNWKEMGRFLKMGLLGFAVAGCIIGALLLSAQSIGGNMLVLSAAVLTGVLLAVFGQTYQTGADAFELFVSWALLISGWTAICCFAPLWIFWLAVADTGLILYWMQVLDQCYNLSYEWLFIVLAAIHIAALAMREYFAHRSVVWLQGRWHRNLLLTAVLVSLTIPAVMYIFEGSSEIGILAILLWIIAAVACYMIYRWKLHDILPVAQVVTNACILFIVVLTKLLFDSGSGSEFSFLFMGLLVIGVVSAAAWWLRKTARTMSQEDGEAKT